MIAFYRFFCYYVSMVKRGYKYRFYPTAKQEQLLLQTFGCVRLVWNRTLDARTKAWRVENKGMTYSASSQLLTEWKKGPDLAFLNDVSSAALQQKQRDLQEAFQNFWNKKANYPRFKSKRKSRDSFRLPKSGFTYQNGQITLAKMKKPLNIVWSRPLPKDADPSSITISRDKAGRYFISILVEEEIEQLPKADKQVGIDLGIKSFATLSNGTKIANPKHEVKDRKKLAKAQKTASRKQLGSNNRAKAMRKVARIYARIADRRKDFLHKLSTDIVRENQTIVVEDLQVQQMLQKQKTKAINRATTDVGWGSFIQFLEYKCEWYGREFKKINPYFPSTRMCSHCGHVRSQLSPNIRNWTCQNCNTKLDRDINAANNILAVGTTAAACGDGRSRSHDDAQLSKKQESSLFMGEEVQSSRFKIYLERPI